MAPMGGAYPGDWRQTFRPDMRSRAAIGKLLAGISRPGGQSR
jgi:hypothetical protein